MVCMLHAQRRPCHELLKTLSYILYLNLQVHTNPVINIPSSGTSCHRLNNGVHTPLRGDGVAAAIAAVRLRVRLRTRDGRSDKYICVHTGVHVPCIEYVYKAHQKISWCLNETGYCRNHYKRTYQFLHFWKEMALYQNFNYTLV